jgi:hypothetical protein
MADYRAISGTSSRLPTLLGMVALAVIMTGTLWVGDAHAQRKKVVFGEDSVGSEVIGQVHKPEVGYIITRQEQEDLETLQLKESFLPKIVKSVEKKPF